MIEPYYHSENSDFVLYHGNTLELLPHVDISFDMVFADPPYQLPHLDTLPDQVLSHNLLKTDGLFVLEHGKQNDFSDHPHFVDHRSYGSVNFSFFRKAENGE